MTTGHGEYPYMLATGVMPVVGDTADSNKWLPDTAAVAFSHVPSLSWIENQEHSSSGTPTLTHIHSSARDVTRIQQLHIDE